ncbi:unnamed protein product [Moritella viscosa]|uniref:Uncharacterized protein n=1 Tax=Moritella viscosa TaxID=80854 RepID=A0A1L0A9P9_9GAMM|nr:unnamed protein product [Moritella viscosa]
MKTLKTKLAIALMAAGLSVSAAAAQQQQILQLLMMQILYRLTHMSNYLVVHYRCRTCCLIR